MLKKKDYEKEYNEFWKNIVENEDGTLNKEQVMKELSDYSMVLDNCTDAYCLLTDDRISMPNTNFFEVEKLFNQLYLDKEIVIDDIGDLLKINDLEELKDAIRDYFEINL